MTISSVLLVSALALLGNSQSTSLDSGGNMVADIMNRASQNAAANNAMTAVILASDSAQGTYNRTFAIYALTAPANGQAPTSANWTQVSKWQALPQGVIVDQSTMKTSAQSPAPAFPAIQCNGTTVNTYQYSIFLPQGNLLGGLSTQLRLAPGFFPAGGVTPTYTGKTSGGLPANYFTISVIAATGRVKIDRP